MPFKTFREESKQNYGHDVPVGNRMSDESLMLGAVLRIADAVEKSVEDRRRIDSELAYYKKLCPELRQEIESLTRKISADKGVKTKLKNKIKSNDNLIMQLRRSIVELQSK